MKKITFFLLLISISARAQEPGFNRFFIAPTASINYCYRTLVNNIGADKSVLLMMNKGLVPKFAMNMGVNACYAISRHVGVETGIQYANKGYRTSSMPFGFADDPNQTLFGRSVYSYHYLDIPVKANFTFGQKRVRFAADAGLMASIFIFQTTTAVVTNPEGNVERHTSRRDNNGADAVLLGRINGFNWSPLVGVGVDIKINDKMNLRIEPTYYYGMKQIINSEPIAEKLWSGGINATYYIALRAKK
jgi:hypothetical protein